MAVVGFRLDYILQLLQFSAVWCVWSQPKQTATSSKLTGSWHVPFYSPTHSL